LIFPTSANYPVAGTALHVTSFIQPGHKNRITKRFSCLVNTFNLAAILQAKSLNMRTALFLVIAQRVGVISYRLFCLEKGFWILAFKKAV
jgi:hypothetical protein